MSYYYLMAFGNLGLLCMICICAIYRLRGSDAATRVFTILMILTFLEECISYYAAQRYHNNIPVMRVFGVVEIFTVSVYFNYSVGIFRQRSLGWIIAIVNLAIGVADLFLSKSLNYFSTLFMNYEAIVIIAMGLFSIYQLIASREYLVLPAEPHFWFSALLIFFWSITFLNWRLYDLFTAMLKGDKWIIDASLFLVNTITHLAILFIYIRYPKIRKGYV